MRHKQSKFPSSASDYVRPWARTWWNEGRTARLSVTFRRRCGFEVRHYPTAFFRATVLCFGVGRVQLMRWPRPVPKAMGEQMARAVAQDCFDSWSGWTTHALAMNELADETWAKLAPMVRGWQYWADAPDRSRKQGGGT